MGIHGDPWGFERSIGDPLAQSFVQIRLNVGSVIGSVIGPVIGPVIGSVIGSVIGPATRWEDEERAQRAQ